MTLEKLDNLVKIRQLKAEPFDAALNVPFAAIASACSVTLARIVAEVLFRARYVP